MSTAQPIASSRSVTGIPSGKLAILWVIGSEIVIFGGLLASYVMLRLFHDSWGHDAANTNTLAGSINTFVLLTSSLFIVLGHHAAEMKDGKKAFKYMWLTILGAVVFLIVKSIEWTGEITQGETITKSLFWAFYYTAAGIHALHIIAGAIVMAVISFDVRRNVNLQRVEVVGLYWHFVDIVWIFLFPLLYIAK